MLEQEPGSFRLVVLHRRLIDQNLALVDQLLLLRRHPRQTKAESLALQIWTILAAVSLFVVALSLARVEHWSGDRH